jgi:hypothetical protein
MSQLQVTGEAKIRAIQGPVVANSGIITALDGEASQYVRGDGTLADFPTSSGGGSSVSYYLNSSVSQGTIGGVAYRELSKEPIIGAGTDIAISANGYVASYLTDANDPDVILVPGGNFNCEFYFSVNNETGNPTTYAELYKYDGTTFTLLGSSVGVPESINQGSTIAPYYFAIPVATATLALTDRLAIRIYVNVDGRTVTLHTENGHLCQVVTTLSKGMVSLNNLTDQSQFLTTGTSGTNFAIVSSGDTHTFNLPIASATNTGKLSSTDWSTFNNKVPYTGATGSVDLGVYSLSAGSSLNINGNTSQGGALSFKQYVASSTGSSAGYTGISALGTTQLTISFNTGTTNYKNVTFDASSVTNNTVKILQIPDASGTIALTSNLSSYVPYTGATQSVNLGTYGLKAGLITTEGGYNFKILSSGTLFENGYSVLSSVTGNVSITQAISAGNLKTFTFDFSAWATNTSRTYTLPDLSGTLALLEGTQTFSGAKTFSALSNFDNVIRLKQNLGSYTTDSGYTTLFSTEGSGIYSFGFYNGVGVANFLDFSTANGYRYTFPAASGTLALTSDINNAIIGTTGRVPLFTSTNAIGNSQIYDNGTTVGVGSSVTSANKLVSVLTTDSSNAYAIMAWGTGINTGGFYSNVKSGNIFYAQGEVGGVSAERFKVTNAGNLSASGTGTFGGALSGTSSSFNSLTAIFNAGSGTGSLGIGKWLTQPESNAITRTYFTGSDASTYGRWEIYRSTSTTPTIIHQYNSDGTQQMYGALSGTSATFSNILTIDTNDQSMARVRIKNTGTSGGDYSWVAGVNNVGNAGFSLLDVTNNLTRLYVSPTGSIGVGTISPGYTATSRQVLAIDGGAGAGQGSILAFMLGGVNKGYLFSIQNDMELWCESGELRIGNNANASLILKTNNTDRLTISGTGAATFSSSVTATNGIFKNPGSSPNNTLFLQTSDYSSGSAGSLLRLGHVATTGNTTAIIQNLTAGGTTAGNISFPEGNVGIGTSSPTEKLQVVGSLQWGSATNYINTSNDSTGIYMEVVGTTNSTRRLRLQGLNDAGNRYTAIKINAGSEVIAFDTANEERMTITSGGNVLIGSTTDNGYALQINGSGTTPLYTRNTGASSGNFWKVGPDSSNNYLVYNQSNAGVYLANGATSWTANSDERLKNINSVIDSALSKLMTLRAVNFSWKSDNSKTEVLGLIAQDVEKVFPQVIDKNKLPSKPEEKQTDETEYLGVRYTELIPVLIAAIQELETRIKQLENK